MTQIEHMDRTAFFAALRPCFGGKLEAAQATGIEAILDAADAVGMTDPNHVANVMAQVRHETGGYMSPIKETVMRSHKDKNPSDKTVIDRLNRAYAAGKLPWVKTPYWRDGWFGRGPVQVTHRKNYEKIGKAIGVDLVDNRDLALDPRVGAMIAVVGMRDGLFTGKKLADYTFPNDLEAAPRQNPRRIINGVDGSDREVAKFHREFHKALERAGMGPVAWPDHVREPVKNEHDKPNMSSVLPQNSPKSNTVGPALIGVGIAGTVVTWWGEITSTVSAWVDALTFWN